MRAYLGTGFPRIFADWVATILVGLALLTSAVWAQDEGAEAESARRAMDIARTTMSPFCPGRTLDGCPSPKAAEWRADIRKWVDEGLSKQEIQERLQGRVPKKDLTGDPDFGLGVGFAAAAFITALGFLVLILRRLSAPAPAENKTSPDAKAEARIDDDPELDRRLEAELRDTE